MRYNKNEETTIIPRLLNISDLTTYNSYHGIKCIHRRYINGDIECYALIRRLSNTEKFEPAFKALESSNWCGP